MDFIPPDYAAQLRQFVHGYEGTRERAVSRAGDVFDFYTNLYTEARLHRDARAIVNAVIAYFVVPEDVLPETLGPYGLLDDLYVAAHAFRWLRKELPREVLSAAWPGDDDLDQAMKQVYSESKAELGKLAKDTLKMAGLS